MTKEEFKTQLEEILKQIDRDAVFETALSDWSFSFASINGYWIELAFEMLSQMVNDKESWIFYWVFDLERGTKDGNVRDKDGKKIPLKTIEDLYGLIKSEY